MSTLTNPYDILGLWHSASEKEVECAYETIISMIDEKNDKTPDEYRRRATNARDILVTAWMCKTLDLCIARKESNFKKDEQLALLGLKEGPSKDQILAAWERFRQYWDEYENAALVVFETVRGIKDQLLRELK
ncbi:hypothetical protein Slin15195_G059960 [Septoria linicola]|uniref:Uncharacterized protein n=1 Tax=Septoria linicola TaxID=215465 RepID=A0A9Q9AVE3_9PEZI|nr:hypothetical protein Slin14017_G075810 [Septoria linicola]USW52677.1 hypothetical protein Slin15195_G059960 [Septoria linicola]